MTVRSNRVTNSLSVLVWLLLFSSNLHAHTDNEATLFPDISSLNSRFDVILLVSMGMIPETEKFRPAEPLSRTDLAAWAAMVTGLAAATDDPDINSMADIALKNGLVDSIQGNANYSDINNVIFDGQLVPVSPDAEPDRAEAASYIAENLDSGPGGETLLDRKNMYFGPVGKVSSVESRMNPDGGTSYFVTIAGETYPVYTHGKVANGPTDIKLWQDRVVRRSLIRNLGQFKLWVYLEAGDNTDNHHHDKEQGP